MVNAAPDPALLPDLRSKISELIEDVGSEAAVELIQDFAKDATPTVEKISALHQQSDWPELKREAHSYKSVARVYGLTQLSDVAEAIEHTCIEENWSSLPPLVTDLAQANERGLATLLSYLSTEHGVAIEIAEH